MAEMKPMMPNKPAGPQPGDQSRMAAPAPKVVKPSVAEIVAQWADGLKPQNAPLQKDVAPLAWVRNTKAPELIELLKAAGHT